VAAIPFQTHYWKKRQGQIGLERKSMHGLAALLPERRQRGKLSGCNEARLLIEFAFCAGKQIAGLDVTLRNRPGAVIFVAPIGATRVSEQQFKPRLAAEDEDAGAHL
jgi:hypothetical protein